MGLIEDRHTYEHQGHRIEIVEDGVAKRVRLLVDGREIASESSVLPREITIDASVGEAPLRASVRVRFLRGSVVSLEVDGVPLRALDRPRAETPRH
jgi:hypothetical protein